MKSNEKEILSNVAEELLGTIHSNRTATMAINFFSECCSSEGIEAVQHSLRQQEATLLKLFEIVGGLSVGVHDNSDAESGDCPGITDTRSMQKTHS
jgi:hypothetical protein